MTTRGRSLAPGILLVVAFTAGCGEKPSGVAAELTRSASASPVFPTDPILLAAALGVPVDSLRAAAEERYGGEEYDSARAILQVEAVRARDAGDVAAEARARMSGSGSLRGALATSRSRVARGRRP